TTFIVAVDPDVVTEGLAMVHPGWKDAPEFLAKILQFHYWLQPLGDAVVADFARRQGPMKGLEIPDDVISELASVLPTNPRKLKEFFRSLWQLHSVVSRHGNDEVEWALLLLMELLRAEDPVLAASLLAIPSFRKEIALSTFFFKTSDGDRHNE